MNILTQLLYAKWPYNTSLFICLQGTEAEKMNAVAVSNCCKAEYQCIECNFVCPAVVSLPIRNIFHNNYILRNTILKGRNINVKILQR